MTETKIKPIHWNLAGIWNGVAFKENKPLRKRDYVYASEIGGPLCDRFLKMNAVEYTNPPNNRSLRKFLAGNLIEFVTKQILISAGIYKREEVKVDEKPYEDCLEVHGRCDFIAGGYIDGELARINVASLNLPEFLFKIADKLIASMEGQTLEEKILELKAVSTFAMDRVERTNNAIPSHTLQAYHYHRSGINADVAYICKDDCRMAQFKVHPEVAEPLYHEDLKQITYYFNRNEQPPIEKLAKFDETLGKFSKNLGVEYSPYLTKLYGFATPDEYRESVKYIDKWNRCLSRYVLVETGSKTATGKPMLLNAKNKEGRAEIEAAGYDFNSLMECKIRLGVTPDEDEPE